MQELLKNSRLVELFEDLLLFLHRQHRPVGQLDVVLEPIPPVRLADVHELDADGVAIGRLQVGDDVPQGRWPNADLAARLEGGVEVRFVQPEVGDAEVRTVIPARTHRVGLGKQVTAGPVGEDQVDHPEFLGSYRRA